VGLAACQLFFVPTGIMYWRASRSSAADIADVRDTLAERAASAVPPTPMASRTVAGTLGTQGHDEVHHQSGPAGLV
jgi:hypothetical protein